MIPLGFALDMMLLLMSTIISLALFLGLGTPRTPGALRITICPPKLRIDLIFEISAIFRPIGISFGYDSLKGVSYHLFRVQPYHRI